MTLQKWSEIEKQSKLMRKGTGETVVLHRILEFDAF